MPKPQRYGIVAAQRRAVASVMRDMPRYSPVEHSATLAAAAKRSAPCASAHGVFATSFRPISPRHARASDTFVKVDMPPSSPAKAMSCRPHRGMATYASASYKCRSEEYSDIKTCKMAALPRAAASAPPVLMRAQQHACRRRLLRRESAKAAGARRRATRMFVRGHGNDSMMPPNRFTALQP